MNPLISLLSSRKTWITMFGIIVSALGVEFGASPEQVFSVAGLCALLVVAIASEDAASKLSLINVNLGESNEESAKLMLEAKKVADSLKPKVVQNVPTVSNFGLVTNVPRLKDQINASAPTEYTPDLVREELKNCNIPLDDLESMGHTPESLAKLLNETGTSIKELVQYVTKISNPNPKNES